MKMKLIILVVCSLLIATSLAGPSNLEDALNDLEVVLQDLKHEESMAGDIPRASQLPDDRMDVETQLSSEFLGDIPMGSSRKQTEEILLHTDNIESTTAEIEEIGGRVTIQLGKDLLIAQVPGDVATQQSFSSASTHVSSSASEETLSNVQAYWSYRHDNLKPQPSVQQWTERSPPQALPQAENLTVDEADSPYRQTLTGKIAVVVIAVSGPGSLAISSTEYSTIKSEVVGGLQFWADKAPSSAGLSFAVCSGKASISVSDNSYCSKNSFAACHDRFANAALQYFGYSTGQAGRDTLAQNCKRRANADGAYIAFFSKYKQSHFAYAYFGGGPIYMQYSNDGWGSNQIDRVFAHETGHVFNAPDEYTNGNCNCNYGYGRGTCTDKNSNCIDCINSQSGCIMDSNDLNNLCEHSRKHVGWC